MGEEGDLEESVKPVAISLRTLQCSGLIRMFLEKAAAAY